MTFLPGVAPESATERPRPAVVFSEGYWADEEESLESAIDDEADAGDDLGDEPLDRDTVLRNAAAALTRALGRRGLSIAEAKARLRAQGLADDESTGVIDEFTERGWLDDAELAEQLAYAATTRKDMGTRAVRQLLVKRLVARDVIDAVIGELPDDDAERALEFARAKARSLLRYDDDTATRRLMGMLARRGFGGSVAGQAARTALADERTQAGGSGVRFR